jgi:hypothetical protein
VEALARFGIHVSEGLVHRVKIEMLKDTAGIRREKARIPKAKPLVQRPPKIPRSRSYRR